MSEKALLPRILIIDDLFGRTHVDRRNEERANLCGQYLIEDVTGDETGKGTPQKIKRPIAQAVFYRGLKPACSTVGDTVEHDLQGTLRVIRDGWTDWRPDKPRWAMVLLDLCFYTGRVTHESNKKTLGMPEGRDGDDDPNLYFGLRILQAIQDEFPDLPVIILSSKPREEVSHGFTYRGARGFLPREDEQSPELLRKHIWSYGLIPDDEGEIVGHSKAILLALRTARLAASNRRNVLIRGERGTGKELLANYIHRQRTDRQRAPFIAVNSAVFTSELFASELFGIEARVATGVDRRAGKITEADGGDLFFDEIKDMPPQVQAGILRVLEERRVTPVGVTRSQAVDIRFLSATNIDIEGLAASGNFRSDLLDRLREGGTIFLPPLRDRKEDIPLLVEKFVREAENAKPGALRRQIDPEALEKICSYDWPGNIRELQSCIFSAVNDYSDVEHLVPVHIKLQNGKKPLPPPPKDLRELISAFSAALDSAEQDELQQLPDIQRLIARYLGNERPPPPLPKDLKGLISALTESFQSARQADLRQTLPDIQGLVASYLKGALEATGDPDGTIHITPAVSLITGDYELKTTKAADLIKKLLRICPEVTESLLADPILKKAYENALELRPRQQNSKKKEKHLSGTS